MISGSNFRNARPHFSHDAGSLVSEYERSFRRPVATCWMQIAVANARCFHFDEHFSGMRPFEYRLLDHQRLALFPQDCCVDLHIVLKTCQFRCHVREQLDSLIKRCETSVVGLAAMIAIEDLL